MPSETVRVFFEPKIPLHGPELYAFERIDEGVPAKAAGDPAALDRYRVDGFLMVRGLLPTDEVRAARAELEAMALADAPSCAMIWYEAALAAITWRSIRAAIARSTGVRVGSASPPARRAADCRTSTPRCARGTCASSWASSIA